MDINIKPIRDFVESSLKRSVGLGVMRGDPVVRVDVAAEVAVDAVGMALRMFNEAVGKQDLDAVLDQRQKERLLSAAAVIYAVGHPNVRPTLEDASMTALRLQQWVDVHATMLEREDDDTASRETGTEAEGRNEVDASEGPAAAATTEGRS